MSDRITSGDYPTESYDWDYAEPEPARPKVLWGRVAILGVALLLAFWIGRTTASGGGVSEEEYNALQEKFLTTQDELGQAEAQLDQLQATPTPGAGGGGGGGGNKDEAPEADEDNAIHTVASNETLVTIAEACYGDPTLDAVILEANPEITDTTALAIGQQLIIPPNPNTGEPPDC